MVEALVGHHEGSCSSAESSSLLLQRVCQELKLVIQKLPVKQLVGNIRTSITRKRCDLRCFFAVRNQSSQLRRLLRRAICGVSVRYQRIQKDMLSLLRSSHFALSYHFLSIISPNIHNLYLTANPSHVFHYSHTLTLFTIIHSDFLFCS